MAARGKLAAADCNFVHVDESWKTYVMKERVMSRRWNENWGFLAQEYRKLRADIDATRGLAPSSSAQHQPPESLHLPSLPPSPQDMGHPFPSVTSREVGWRSARRQYQLEVYGRWGRPKVSILRHLNWPNDAVP